MDLLAQLSRSLPLVLLVLGLLLLLLVIFLVLLVRSRRKRQEEEEQELAAAIAGGAGGAGGAGAAGDVIPVDFTGLDASLGLAASFARGLRLLKRHVSGAGYRSQIPWFLFLGEEATGKHALLENAGMDLPRGVPEPGQGCAWWLFDRGVLLDIAPSFVLDASGRSSDETRFQQLLRLLKRHRAERPIDGIVLVLPGPDLARPGERPAERTARAERKATILAGKIREAQTRLGLRLPIYLLVTGGETLHGFAEFFDELPERLKDEMFGWSSPYGVETAYRSEWVDEAVSGIRRDLLAAQLEVLAERRQAPADAADAADADALFSFPDEILAWKEPLRIYADRLFRPSAYHESIFPRGIYVCATDPVSRRSLFLKDLFERKVFPEHNLARPTAKTFGSQGRAVRILQVSTAVAALVLAVGLGLAYRHLDNNRRALQSFLEKALYSLNELRTIRLAQQKPTAKLLERQTFQLFEDMSGISTDRFGSLFIPQSWFNPFHRELQRAIGVAYDHIIYRGFKYGLAARVDDLASYRAAGEGGEASESPLPLEGNSRFRELRDYADRAVALEKNVDIYNSLKATQRLEDMGSLVKYLYDRNLSEDLYQEARLFRTALSFVQVQPFVFFDAKKEGAHLAVKDMTSRLYQNLYRENPESKSLEELTRRFEAVGQGSLAQADESVELSRLLQQMERLEAQVSRADLAPLAAPGFNLGPAYDQVLTRIGASALLGSAAATEAREDGRREQQAFRQTLSTYGWSPYLEPYLVEKGNAFVFSPDLKLLYGALADFLRQSATPEGRDLAIDDRLAAGQRLDWDLPLLDQAVALYEPYKSFSEHGLAAFPSRLKEPLRAMAAERVTAGITDLVVRAARGVPAGAATDAQLEQDLRDQVDGLTAAVKPVGQLCDIYRRLGLPRNDQRLALLLARQGYGILRGLDRLLADERLYAPRQGSFTAWDGTKPLAARAFVSGDPAELPAYLDKQRERIAYLDAEYATPVLKTVAKSDAQRDQDFLRLYERWMAIDKGLKDYEAKKAGNSLASLEGLVLQDLEEVELASCAQKVFGSGTGSLAGGDYFGCTASHLRRDLLRRCYGLAVDGYSRIARLFDSRLAGRYPFADTLPGRADAEADPEAIREFFALFDRYAPMLLAAPREGELAGGRVREFVLAMQGVRAFFAPFLDGDGRIRPPVYDVAVDFRVEKGDEIDGNQVLRWQLAAGDRFARENAPEPERHLRWTLGTPVAVTLGWAKDSPFVPVDGKGQELPDKAATFAYANRWSLLSLAQDHPLSVREPGETAARTLEFVLPTKNPATGAPGKTRVFLRLTFRPAKPAEAAVPAANAANAGKDKEKETNPELALPRFPTRAPSPEPLPARVLAATREEAPCAP